MSTRSLSAGTATWEEIAARRHAGDAPEWPQQKQTGRRVLVVLAIAAALALIVTPLIQPREELTPEHTPPRAKPPSPEADNPFLPGALMAQTSPHPAFTAVLEMGRSLRPGRWTYGYIDSAKVVRNEFGYELSRSTYQQSPAWLMIAGYRHPESGWQSADSLWASIDQFRPLYRVWSAGKNTRIEQTYREHEVLVGTTSNGYTSWKVKALRDTADNTRNGGRLRMQDLALQLGALPLSADWKGSVPIPTEDDIGIASIWLNLSVDGEEVIETPAGRFACWRIRTAHPDKTMPVYHPDNPDPGLYFWISKEKLWLVQSIFVNGGKSWSRFALTSVREDQL